MRKIMLIIKNNLSMLFESKCQLVNNNIIEIYIKEYYLGVTLPSKNYNDYRRIVNSAADFHNLKILFKEKAR